MDRGYIRLPSSQSPIIKMIKVTVLLIGLSIGLSQGASISCSQPSNQTLQQQHSQFSTHSGVLLPTIDVNTISSDFVTQNHLYGDSTCPTKPASGEDDAVESRALCPWYYVINHNPKRYPTSLSEAKCRCQNCIYNDIAKCEPVTYSLQVLEQTDECSNGYYVYEPKWVKLSVGCTCAMPRTAPAKPIVDEGGPDI